MSPVKVPDFAALVSAQPLSTGPSGAAVWGPMLGQSLLSVSQSIINQRKTKNMLTAFADEMETIDPDTAAIYRAMAESTPSFDSSAVIGSPSGAGTRGAASMGAGDVMQDMLGVIKDKRREASELKVLAARSSEEVMLTKLRSGLEMEKMRSGLEATLEEIKAREGSSARLLDKKAQLDAEEDARLPESTKQELLYKQEYLKRLDKQIEAQQQELNQMESGTFFDKGATGKPGAVTSSHLAEALALDPKYSHQYNKLMRILASSSSTEEEKADAKEQIRILQATVRRALGGGIPNGSAPSNPGTFDVYEALKLR